MANTKLTKKEKFEMIKEILVSAEVEADVETLVQFINDEIALLEKRKAKVTEKRDEKADALLESVKKVLTGNFQTITEIAEAIGTDEATPAKVAYRLNALVKAGVVEKLEQSFSQGKGERSRRIQTYKYAEEFLPEEKKVVEEEEQVQVDVTVDCEDAVICDEAVAEEEIVEAVEEEEIEVEE